MSKYKITQDDMDFIEDDYHDMYGEDWEIRGMLGFLAVCLAFTLAYAWLIGAF